MHTSAIKIKAVCRTLFQHYADIIISVIPCIIVTSLLGALINICTGLPLIQGQALTVAFPALTDLCGLLELVFRCGILLLPVYVSWATVRHFQGTELCGIFVGLTLVPAGLTDGMSAALAITEGSMEYWRIGSISIPQAGFQGQSLVAILAGYLLVVLERQFKKRIPQILHIFLVPVLSITLTVLCVYMFIGPAARGLETILAQVFTYLFTEPALKNISGLILGFFQLPMMLFGIHLAFISVNLQLIGSGGGTPIWPITVTSVLSAGGAALAVLLFQKSKLLYREAREGALITLGLGTVEPALFGVCAKNKYAMAGALISAAASGFACSYFDCRAVSFGLNGFMSFLNMEPEQWLPYGIAVFIAVFGSFFLTGLFLRFFEKEE